MDDHEFLRLLDSYPVVRKKTHCRVQWNDMHDKLAAQPLSSGIFIPAGQESVILPTDTVEEAIEKFLAPCFASNETTKIQKEFEKTLNDFVSSLNLEDINDLCAQFVDSE
ncbi:uncharacterized protein PHALS_05910 [Plasmopara halstedii]|uniref:Uncharacterized protein n=1 Tax=Plasmopara halstedii TaxID=4781 RepID=A0A0N7L471_PLAHL|nr:uncharacterized protein PHALS_05910 [Plasmopara halstedii]CEG37859.1 hypothetical protein PHALS_05910 [Plasmopara halstedii]|eukprot:XP_024574228.1 hypothetical protein PHALS_05910 [Plasmopara halstedii]